MVKILKDISLSYVQNHLNLTKASIYLYINANIFKAFLRHRQSHKHTLRSNFSELKCKSIISGIYSYLC